MVQLEKGNNEMRNICLALVVRDKFLELTNGVFVILCGELLGVIERIRDFNRRMVRIAIILVYFDFLVIDS